MRIVDASEMDEAEFAAALALRQSVDTTKDPDIPPPTDREFRLLVTVDDTDEADHDRVVAFEDSRAVAIGHLERTRDSQNQTFAVLEIHALDDDLPRTRPVLRRLLDMAEADGRTSIFAWGDLTPAREQFWTSLGATRRTVDRDSDLFLDEVDAELMARWIEAREERAAAIGLVGWVDVCPEEHIDAVVATRNAMNDAPWDDIEAADFVATVEGTRRDERARRALGQEMHNLLAIEQDGSAAGLTQVMINNHRPEASWQWDTVVLRRHRRRGVGRWLKAEMWRHLRAERPDVTRLRTGNAESNDAMLAINVAMGFRPTHSSAGWQTDLATLRTGLDG